MILELDCGNSFIKWRLLGDDGCTTRSGVNAASENIIAELQTERVGQISNCRLVSVRSELETQTIVQHIAEALGVNVVQARPSLYLAGVKNGYQAPERLGLDRWLAIVGAYSVCRGACVIIDVGTAVTVDLVAGDGAHLGGYIAPGMGLLRGQLLSHTRRIRYGVDEAALALSNIAPGTSTAEAVERGCLLMLRSYITTQLAQAEHYLGQGFDAYLTGGDATLVADLPSVSVVPDLVFKGLALACP